MGLMASVLYYWFTVALASFLIFVLIFLFKTNKSDIIITWKSFVVLFLIILVSPSVLVIIPIILLYKRLIDKILKSSYGKDYGGLLSGGDVVHMLEKAEESKIKVLFMIDYDQEKTTNFFDHVKNRILTSKVIKCQKTRAIFKRSYGYYYYLKDQINVEDCVKKLTLKNNNREVNALMQFIEESESCSLPHDNAGLWDVSIGTHPINWKPEMPDKTYYPILLRFHHSLFDGYHLLTTTIGNFGDRKMENEKVTEVELRQDSILKKLYTYVRQFCELCTFPWRVFIMFHENNRSILCKTKLQNKKIFTTSIEDVNHKYIKVIKEIKQKLNDASFTDIVLAALSSSFSEHITKKSKMTPNYISIATPEVPTATDLLRSGMQGDEASLRCKNQVYFSVRKLPISKSMTMLDRVNMLKNQGGFLKSPYQIMADYYAANFMFSIVPDVIMKKIVKVSRTTAIVTNLPGPPKVKCFSGNTLENILLWSISKGTTSTGIGIVIFTYGNSLQISISADKAVISNKHELNDMVANIYKSIDELHRQLTIKTN